MTQQLQNIYYVGEGQPYSSVNSVLSTIKSIIDSGDFSLPDDTHPDGGNVNIVIVGGGAHQPFRIPDSLTPPIAAEGKRLVIRRLEYQSNGQLESSTLPIITSTAPGAEDVPIELKTIGVNIGNNNPNVTIRGLRIQDTVMGIIAGFGSNNLEIDRNFITNARNVQIYAHDLEGAYITNNVVVGGEYGIVLKHCKKIRAYHNTVFVDGSTALSEQAKAGVIIQGERFFNNSSASTTFFLGNLVYTIGAPALIVYREDIDQERLVSDYNDLYSPDGVVVQVRQDNAQLPEDSDEIIQQNFTSLTDWMDYTHLATDSDVAIDQHSISVHPVFIFNISNIGIGESSILDLTSIDNSPLLSKVPSWYADPDTVYIPTDFDELIISRDSLLKLRETPFTAIGANDGPSYNGFFGQDIFTSPVLFDPERSCDVDPLKVIANQNVNMSYPMINAGYFWSYERPYYLYGKKWAAQLGFLARTTFRLPGRIVKSSSVQVRVNGKLIDDENWDIIGNDFIVYHRSTGIASYEDEVEISCEVAGWNDQGFYHSPATYIFKIKDGKTDFVLPDSYQSSGPVVITDDRVSLLNPIDVVNREFVVEYDEQRQENVIKFDCKDNLISNSIFNLSRTFKTPKYWETDVVDENNPTVFMAGTPYAYYGDYCVAIKVDGNAGWIGSPKVNLNEKTCLTFSWHARLPEGLTDDTGAVTSLDANYKIKFYDHNKDELLDSYSGSFTMYDSGYRRYFCTIGNDEITPGDNIYEAESAPLVNLGNLGTIPSGAVSAQLVIEAIQNTRMTDGSFMLLDAVQAERDSRPSYFHPDLSFDGMTVECESSEDGYFVDKRLNISSVFNENPNGFLYITDMPASLWGGPTTYETTTLHEYRWPIGRMTILPWARLHGKDKLHQRVYVEEEIGRPLDIIAPFNNPKLATEVSMTPGVLHVPQYSGHVEGVNFRVIDQHGNPYSLRNFVVSAFEENGQFPGWLSKRYFGAKEQLGTTVYGKLNSNGSISLEYIPPSTEGISVITNVPVPQTTVPNTEDSVDSISFVKTPYRVSLENNGNITIIGESGLFQPVHGTTPISGEYIPESVNNKTVVSLEYPPVFGSVELIRNGVVFSETQSDPQADEFFVDYPHGQLVLQQGLAVDVPVEVKYLPKYAYPDPDDPTTIIIHNNHVFGNYDGPIKIDYDAEVFLEIRVEQPLTGELVGTFPVILQNPQLSNVENSSLALEF
ncbi:MAG: hypothetical protein D6710_01890 [Nitrospirae bacterium]|nr:MAG: hypothetical protein D6710_01890 [Nitrospirota bacterium]